MENNILLKFDTKYINRKINKIIKTGFNNIELAKLLKESELIFEISNKINFDKGLAYSFYFNGVVYNYLSEFDKAKKYLLKAYKIFENNKDILSLCRVCNSLGYNYTERNNYLKGLFYYQKILYYSKKYKKVISHDIYLKTLNNIGIIYLKNNLFKIARNYFFLALNIAEEKKFLSFKPVYYENIGITYAKEKLFDEALKYFNLAIKSLYENKNLINEIRGLSNIYYEIGLLYKSKKEFDLAYLYFMNSIFYSLKVNSSLQIVYNNIEILKIYLKKRKFRNFLKLAKNTLALAIKIKAIEPRKEIYKILSKFFSIKKDFNKSLHFIKKYIIEQERLSKELINSRLITKSLELFDIQKEKEMEIYEIKNNKLKLKNNEIKSILSQINQELKFSQELFNKIFQEQSLFMPYFDILSIINLRKKNINLCNFIKKDNDIFLIILRINLQKLISYFFSLIIYTLFIKFSYIYDNSLDIYNSILSNIKIIIKKNLGKKINILIGKLDTKKNNINLIANKSFNFFYLKSNQNLDYKKINNIFKKQISKNIQNGELILITLDKLEEKDINNILSNSKSKEYNLILIKNKKNS